MTWLPAFARRLDLGPDADERAVRRAYARELKRIDQEADPQGFQDLREAYEAALDWARRGARQEAAPPDPSPEPLPPPAPHPPARLDADLPHPPAEPEPEPEFAPGAKQEAAVPSPEAAADAVMAAMLAALGGREASVRSAEGALHAAMADERLQAVDARDWFEWLVAARLAQGWQPGHEALFSVAVKCFSWTEDPRRLRRFGAVGARLDAAIHELLVFNDQTPEARERCMALIRRLRSTAEPERARLAGDAALLAQLVSRFPTLLPTITSDENIGRWQAAAAGLQPNRWGPEHGKTGPDYLMSTYRVTFEGWPKRRKTGSGYLDKKASGWNPGYAVLVLILFAVIRVISSQSGPAYEPAALPPASSTYREHSGATDYWTTAAPAGDAAGTRSWSGAPGDPLFPPQPLPPLSDDAVRALATGPVSSERCAKLASAARAYGMGTAQPLARFGREAEAQVLRCVDRKYWIYDTPHDAAVHRAMQGEQERLQAAMRQAAKADKPLAPARLYEVDFAAPEPAPPTPRPPPAPARPTVKPASDFGFGAATDLDLTRKRMRDTPVPADDPPTP